MKKINICLVSLVLFSLSTGVVFAESIAERNQRAEQQRLELQKQKENEALMDKDQKSRHESRMERVELQQRNIAKDVLKKTTTLIIKAEKSDGRKRVYHRNLYAAITHQRFAKKLYYAQDFESAIYQSLRARQLALSVLHDNRVRYKKDDERSDFERDWEISRKTAPTTEELDKRLEKDMTPDERRDVEIKRNSNWTIEIIIND